MTTPTIITAKLSELELLCKKYPQKIPIDECAAFLDWTPTCFTYPFGQISSDTLPILKDMGFQAALTCEEKLNYIPGDPEHLYHLRRFNRPHGKSLQSILQAQKQK
mgnify:CR=1 FL=1